MSTAGKTAGDAIDALAGLAPDSPLAAIRDRKPVTRDQAQASYRALFRPADETDVTRLERHAVAAFVAGLHADPDATAFYAAALPADLAATIAAEAGKARTTGPYGAYPPGPLSREDVAGPVYRPADLDPRLGAALAHVHMLVFHPRDARPEHLQALLDAGWSNTGIVTLSQLTAFLAFQIRAAAGLRVLARTPA
ncbi:MAG TPA: CMD domain protein [Rhodopila sp.]|uniref:CMD domain protein n=1 Tax=Rhodopila sp. TaxID=2480087 RepID=UPI002C51FD27|nr:CMD domain protein [Rhodopila sp.]HVY15552.1 CMD domain protein [Rhodopila sp.]